MHVTPEHPHFQIRELLDFTSLLQKKNSPTKHETQKYKFRMEPPVTWTLSLSNPSTIA
jgi:hypothetical protein